MKLIAQREYADCGVACLAMISNTSYGKALNASIDAGAAPFTRGATCYQLRRALIALTGQAWRTTSKATGLPLRTYRGAAANVLIAISQQPRTGGHWIAATHDGWIYDPLVEKPQRSWQAKRRGYMIVNLIYRQLP